MDVLKFAVELHVKVSMEIYKNSFSSFTLTHKLSLARLVFNMLLWSVAAG